MQPILDLTRCHATHVRGDLTVHLTWITLEEDEAPRPCMVIIRTFGRMADKIPCVVTLDRAWVWSEELADGREAGRVTGNFCADLDLPPVLASYHRILSLVRDYLGDLTQMPPLPRSWRETTILGEGTITERESGRVVQAGEIVEVR